MYATKKLDVIVHDVLHVIGYLLRLLYELANCSLPLTVSMRDCPCVIFLNEAVDNLPRS